MSPRYAFSIRRGFPTKLPALRNQTEKNREFRPIVPRNRARRTARCCFPLLTSTSSGRIFQFQDQPGTRRVFGGIIVSRRSRSFSISISRQKSGARACDNETIFSPRPRFSSYVPSIRQRFGASAETRDILNIQASPSCYRLPTRILVGAIVQFTDMGIV